MRRRFKFSDPIYDRRYQLHVCKRRRFEKLIAGMVREPFQLGVGSHGACVEIRNDDGTQCVAIWIPPRTARGAASGDPDDMGIVVHESSHAILFAFGLVGVPINAEHDEAFCYYHQWLTAEIVRKLRTLRKNPGDRQ